MKNIKVSVIINCLNGERFIKQAIDSVLVQTFKDWELIVWDNASTDGTAEIAKSYGDILQYHRTEKTVPLGTARNYAIDRTSGEYIAFLDCDDEWSPTLLQRMADKLDNDSACGMVYSDGYRINEHGTVIGRYFDGIDCYRGDCFYEFFSSGLAPTPSEVLFRRTALNAVGRFDTRFDICEDYDLYLKISRHYPIEYIPEPLIRYRIHGNNSIRKSDVLVRENSEILDYWLNQEPELWDKCGAQILLRQFKMQCKLIFFYGKRGSVAGVNDSILRGIRIFLKRPLVWFELVFQQIKRRWVRYYRLIIMKYS
jgi:glycosyltransferase involved in cell wall biosynthesis